MRFQIQHFRGTFLYTVLLAAATFVLYASTLNFSFISIDDTLLVLHNPLIQHWSSQTLWRIFTSYDPELYVPLTMLSYHIDFLISGLSPVAYHAQNLFLHILAALLVFRLFLSLRLQKEWAFLGALLFALHPINTEAVAWVSARKDLLSAVFALGSLLAFLEYVHARDRRWFVIAVIFFVLGLLSKVTILLLPALLAVVLPSESLTKKLRTLSPFIVLSAVFAVIAIIGKLRTFGAAIPLTAYPLLAVKATYVTLLHFLTPRGLSPIYPQTTHISVLTPDFFVSFIVVSILAVSGVVLARKSSAVRVGIVLFFVGFLPSFFTFTKNGEVYITSDRYAYLASVGLVWLLVSAIASLWNQLKHDRSTMRHGLSALASITVVSLAFLTTHQLSYWRTNESILRHIIALSPTHALAYNNLGAEFRDQGKTNEAELAYRAAILQDPHAVLPHINLASLFLSQKKPDEAEAEYRSAIRAIDRTKRIQSDDLAGYYLLGNMLSERGDDEAALGMFADAASLAPDIAEAELNLALTLHRLGKISAAVPAYERALTLDPSLTAAHYNLAEIYAGSGRLEEALIELDRVLALDPAHEKASVHMTRIRGMIGR